MLGQDVCMAARVAGFEVIDPSPAELDVTDPDMVARVVAQERPDAIVNCAAYTDVDGAEADEERATAVNGDGAGHVAAAAAANGAFLVHVSTDYVFDGRSDRPYREDDPTAPMSAYGRSKLAGEVAIARAAPEGHVIARTSWLFGVHGRNFVDTMLRLGGEREQVQVVDDQIGCPTFTGHLAPALLALAQARPTGIVHLVGTGSCSWFDLAVETFARTAVECEVRPSKSVDLDRPAPRPAYSVLGSSRPETPALPAWQQGLDDYLSARSAAIGGKK